jgi:LacI family transcriptional regulator
MPITIKDLARLANVSHTTVSRALNNSDAINPKTKERILALAKTYNYIPNYNAKSLVLNKSYNIGCFFTTIEGGTTSSFLHEILLSINKVINNEYSITINGIDEISNFNAINPNRYDGIIIVSQSTSDDLFINHVIESNIPLVVLNRPVDFKNVCCIISDDRIGVNSAVNHLIELGHRQIGFIAGREDFYSTNIRKQGYEDALLNHNIPIDLRLVESGDYSIEGGYKAMNNILNRTSPTAIFASNDDMAIGALKAAMNLQMAIPSDISIIGFDDSFYSSYTFPSLSTVKKPMGEIAAIGATKLLTLIDNNTINKDITCIHTKLIIRDSIKKI